MVVYQCNKCEKCFKSKTDYTRHINRKYSCNRKQDKGYRCKHCNKFYIKRGNLINHIKKIHPDQIAPNSEQKVYIFQQIAPDSEQKAQDFTVPDKYRCNQCKKSFSRKYNLKRHNERFHSNDSQIEDRITQLENEINKLKSKNNQLNTIIMENCNNCNNTNVTNNITNNIKIIAFGKTNLNEILNDELCKKILSKGFNAVPSLIEHVHFNNDMPQYHNCYISNMRSAHAIIFDGKTWKLEDTNIVIDTLKDDSRDFLEEKFEEFYDSLNDSTKRKFQRFLNEADTNVVSSRYKNELKKLLYNNKDTVIKTKEINNKIALIV